MDGLPVVEQMNKFFMYSFIEPVAEVAAKGAASCFTCGYGETCQVGIPVAFFGPGVKITEDLIPNVSKQPDVLRAAAEAGETLGRRLKNGHDRKAVTQKMQQMFMEGFKGTT